MNHPDSNCNHRSNAGQSPICSATRTSTARAPAMTGRILGGEPDSYEKWLQLAVVSSLSGPKTP
jgi:hypothetical protein